MILFKAFIFLSLSFLNKSLSFISKNNYRLRKLSSTITSHSHTNLNHIITNDNLKLLIPTIATFGTAETAYLTWLKFTQSAPIFCGSTGGASCGDVLSGPYSLIPFTNAPLSLIGLLSYGTVLYSSIQSNKQNSKSDEKMYSDITLFMTTAMATFSAYFMYILIFVLQTSCNFCYASAIMSCSMALIAWEAKIVPNITRAFSIASSSALLSFITSVAMFYTTNSLYFPDKADATTVPAIITKSTIQLASTDNDEDETKKPPEITKTTSSEALKVANLLQKSNAKMYGAYWCSHCFNQKNELGKEAYEGKYYQYIECDKKGYNSQFQLCRSNKIPGFPTWEIDGEYYPGEKSLKELQNLLLDIASKKTTLALKE